MVAITVILAAVIATFVLGLGEQVSDTTPNANFQADFASSNDSVSENGNIFVTIQHQSGDQIDVNNLRLGGDLNYNETLSDVLVGDTFSAGDSFGIGNSTSSSANISVTGSLSEGDEIDIIFQSQGDGSGSILRTFELPRDYDST